MVFAITFSYWYEDQHGNITKMMRLVAVCWLATTFSGNRLLFKSRCESSFQIVKLLFSLIAMLV